MQKFKVKIQENGKNVLSLACRNALNLPKGGEVIIYVEDGEAKIISLKHAVKNAQKMLHQYTKRKAKLSDEEEAK